MKVLKEIEFFKMGNGDNLPFAKYECDKCGAVGSMEIPKDADDIPEDKRNCCES